MKPFSLEEHLKNPKRKIVTRDGRSARIVCTDRKSNVDFPIIALVMNNSGEEYTESYRKNGSWNWSGVQNNSDLVFAPEKKVGWMNLYKRDFGLVQGDLVCDSEEAAKKIAAGDEDYISTIKIEWEEE